MPRYSFLIDFEGAELPANASEHDTLAAALQHGCDVLMTPVYWLRPAYAACTVYAGEDLDGVPLGAWKYSDASPIPEWLPAA